MRAPEHFRVNLPPVQTASLSEEMRGHARQVLALVSANSPSLQREHWPVVGSLICACGQGSHTVSTNSPQSEIFANPGPHTVQA